MSAKLSAEMSALHARLMVGADERFRESERFHMGVGEVHKTLESIARNLEDEGIQYTIVGGMALNVYGYKRETVDVGILLTPKGLNEFTDKLVGKGYRPAFEGARKAFRDTTTKVKVEFLTTGEYPGDGKPKPVAFPDPADVAVPLDGKQYISLPGLITLKLASGMTAPGRLHDLGDVQRLIKFAKLDESMAKELHPYVREKFLELLEGARQDTHGEE